MNTDQYCPAPLASYACRPDQTKGRIYEEEESAHRTPHQRDRDRIIHAAAFRRLKHKTQVFVYHEGDHYRTRLTHTLEVAQITRSIARALNLNEDLAEGIALAHDLGHTPFAHIGEEYLSNCMKKFGGFDHNDQSLRVLTTLERKYPRWQGLNLTWETLEGVVKHNGPIKGKPHIAVKELQKKIDLRLDTHASLEAQVAALSDDIAYNNHDVEDGLRAGLFRLDDIKDLPILSDLLKKIRNEYEDNAPDSHIIHGLIREMIGAMVHDVLIETRKRLKSIKAKSPEDIRMAGKQMVAFSPKMEKDVNTLRKFLFERMYHHYTIKRIWLKVERIIGDLFTAFHEKPELLPLQWQEKIAQEGAKPKDKKTARIVADYIAGMTDRYAIREHERLFDLYWDLR